MSDPTHNRFADEAAQASAASSSAGQGPADSDTTGPAAAGRIFDDLALLRDEAALYFTAKQDQLKLGARRVAILAVAGILGLAVAAALLAAAVVVLVLGIAGGLAEALSGRWWLGGILTGGGLILGVAALAMLSIRGYFRASHRKTLERYARLYQQLDARRQAARQQQPGSQD